MSLISEEELSIRTILGTYHPSIYLRTVHVPYTDQDILKLEKQVATGESAYDIDEYDRASSWEEKKHILEIFSTPYHEAFHHFQRLISSYGMYDQNLRTWINIEFLKILFQNNGLPDTCLQDYLLANVSKFERGSPLSYDNLLVSNVLDGSTLYPGGKHLTFPENDFFTVKAIQAKDSGFLPQVQLSIKGQNYPLGATVLMESWAYSALKALIAIQFGEQAVEDYSEKLGIPFFPYKILEYVIKTICPSDSPVNDPIFVNSIVSVVAYYGLNGERLTPQNTNFSIGSFPGFRVASLIV